ncbi:MAG: B12-binding domain-containing radical SAM protein [Methanomicrobiales archaeon]|nr:B12-binding domain-containing radical SAM protein [Methanomicrobiales archaeon]
MRTRIHRCLLFSPPAFSSRKQLDINPAPPLGLGYIAAVLEGMGKEVRIVDCLLEGWNERVEVGGDTIRIGLSREAIAGIIREFRPDLVGVNSQFTRQYRNAHEIYASARAVDPTIVTVAGGAHPSVLPAFAMEDPNLDFVVIGEGEETIRELVHGLENNPAGIAAIDGIALRQGGGVRINPRTRFIHDLDTLPFPAWHLMHVERYFGLPLSHGKRRHARFFSIMTSRGCPAHCVFCTAHNVWGRKYRSRSPGNVVQEIEALKKTYGIEELLVEDDNFTFDIDRAGEICDLILGKDLRIGFDTPNGVAAYRLTPELLSKMQRAGFFRINLAVESGNQQALLKVIKKPLRLDHVAGLIAHCHSIGLECGLFFIVGIPGTSLGEMWDNYRFARRMKVFDPFISIATPYPGSELYDICREKDYLEAGFSLENLYIRACSIRTPDWGSWHLSLLMKAGYLYLKFFQFLDDPVEFLRLFGAWIRGTGPGTAVTGGTTR